MKNIIFVISLLSVSLKTYCQGTIAVEINDEDKIFRLVKSNQIYTKKDTIAFSFEIKNNSNERFFIPDFSDIEKSIVVDQKLKTISIYYAADLSYGYAMNRLRIVEPKDELKFNFKVNCSDLVLKKSPENYEMHIVIGYFYYLEEFRYLAKSDSNSKKVFVERMDDFMKLMSAYKEMTLGKLMSTIKE